MPEVIHQILKRAGRRKGRYCFPAEVHGRIGEQIHKILCPVPGAGKVRVNMGAVLLIRKGAGSLGFPEWYGRNLDALYDCLTDIREEAEICILQMPLLEEKLGRYAVLLLKVLKDAAGENNAIHLKMEEKP